MTNTLKMDEVLLSETTDIKSALSKIGQSWKKTTDAILDTAELLYEYRTSSQFDQIRKKLDEQNIIKDSVQKFLLGIAQNKALMNKQYREYLPPHYNTLYHLSKIKSDVLEPLLINEKIKPGFLLDEARELSEKFNAKKSMPKTPSTSVTFIIKFQNSRGAKTKAKEALDLLQELFPNDEVKSKLIS